MNCWTFSLWMCDQTGTLWHCTSVEQICSLSTSLVTGLVKSINSGTRHSFIYVEGPEWEFVLLVKQRIFVGIAKQTDQYRRSPPCLPESPGLLWPTTERTEVSLCVINLGSLSLSLSLLFFSIISSASFLPVEKVVRTHIFPTINLLWKAHCI